MGYGTDLLKYDKEVKFFVAMSAILLHVKFLTTVDMEPGCDNITSSVHLKNDGDRDRTDASN